jgi:N-acetylmuramoyl-L-alanine amidase
MTKPLPNYSGRDLVIMALTLHGEARGLDTEGQTKVAWVIRNRAQRFNLPFFAGKLVNHEGAIEKVCRAPWQFSCWNEGDPNARLLNALLSEWNRYLERPYGLDAEFKVASAVLEGIVEDITNGSDHYHTVAKPGWAPTWPPVWAEVYGETSRDPGNKGHVFYSSLEISSKRNAA